MMVPKVFVILLMVVCAVAATKKPKEQFETLEQMQKTMEALTAAKAKNETIKKQHAAVKAEHDGIKSKSEAAEALLKKYNGEPTDLIYTEREILDKQNAQKKLDDCFVKNDKIEKEVKAVREEFNSFERREKELKEEKVRLEKEINDLRASIDSYKRKIANLRDIEIPDVKRRIAEHTRDYHACIDQKSWNPSVTGNYLAYWKSDPNQYIATNVNVNESIFTIGLLINAPYMGTYQPIIRSRNNSYLSMSSFGFGFEVALQNSFLLVRNGGQNLTIPITNGLLSFIISQSISGSTYILNGKQVGTTSNNFAVGELAFYSWETGGIKDLSVIRRVLTDDELRKFEGYFAYKWFKSGDTLPSNHPYRYEVPYK